MPILANAKKALRRSKRANLVNSRVRARMRSALKKAESKISAESLAEAQSRLDIAVKKHIIRKNKAARLKQRLAKLLKKTPDTSVKTA